MPDGYKLTGPNGEEIVLDGGKPSVLPEGWTQGYKIDWTDGAELKVKGAGDVMRRILKKLPEPKKWDGAGGAPKASDVLQELKDENIEGAAEDFSYLGFGNDASRDAMVNRAVVANVKGEDDKGVGAMLEYILSQ